MFVSSSEIRLAFFHIRMMLLTWVCSLSLPLVAAQHGLVLSLPLNLSFVTLLNGYDRGVSTYVMALA